MPPLIGQVHTLYITIFYDPVTATMEPVQYKCISTCDIPHQLWFSVGSMLFLIVDIALAL